MGLSFSLYPEAKKEFQKLANLNYKIAIEILDEANFLLENYGQFYYAYYLKEVYKVYTIEKGKIIYAQG